MSVKILGIETSCDETAVAIVDSDKKIWSNLVYSQTQEHMQYGGVVPELAARSHINQLPILIDKIFGDANLNFQDISAVAVTSGPGLMGGVLVGVCFAKALVIANKLPYIAINHLEGHALTARLTSNIEFPYLLLLASGGHCQFIEIYDLGRYKIIGQTLDDAAGEAFDKVAKLLDLPVISGAYLEKLALSGDENFYQFPVPLQNRKTCDMSFSGLKTAVRDLFQKEVGSDEKVKANIAASFQKTVSKIFVEKARIAIKNSKMKNFVFAGGVAANSYLRNDLMDLCAKENVNFIVPPVGLCTDNGAMIAWAGVERFLQKKINTIDFKPRPKWSLEEI